MNKNERLIDEPIETDDNITHKEIKSFSFSKNSPIIISKNISLEKQVKEKPCERKREGNLIKDRKNNKTIINRRNINLQDNSFHRQLTRSNEIKFNENYFTNDNIDDFKLNGIIKNSNESPEKVIRNEDGNKNTCENSGNIICYRNQRHNKNNKYDAPNLIDKTKQLIKETILKDDKINDKEEKENNDKILNHIRDFRQYSLSQDMLDEQTTFYFDQYFEMVLLHLAFFLFGPLLHLFMIYKYGKNLSCNMNFWGDKLRKTLVLQYFFWITTLFTAIISIVILKNTYKDSTSKFNNQYIFLSIGYMSQILIVIRYMTVCVKYGFFPKGYYELFKKEDLMEHSLKSNFLYNGWINPRFKIIDELINESLIENKIDLSIFNLQCIGKIDTKLIHDLKMIELEISEDQEKLKNEYLMYLLKRVQLKKYKDILKNTKIEDKMFKIRKITTDEIDMEKMESPMDNDENKLDLSNKDNLINLSNKILLSQTQPLVEDSNRVYYSNGINQNEEIINKTDIDNNKIDDFRVMPRLPCDTHLDHETFDEKCEKISFSNSLDENRKTDLTKLEKGEPYLIESTTEKNENTSSINNKPLTTLLRNVVINKVYPIIYQNRKKKAEKINTLEGKVKKLSDFVFEINGLYLCRLMMKKAHDINYASYLYYHVLFFITLLIIPNIFLGKMYLLNSNCKNINGTDNIYCNKFNITVLSNGSIETKIISNLRFLEDFNETNNLFKDNKTSFISTNFSSNGQTVIDTKNNTNVIDNNPNKTKTNTTNGSQINVLDMINQEIVATNWSSVSVLIWIFSIISAFIPTWLITKNLIYGMIDFERRRKLLEIIGEIVNINTTGKRDFHLINITHYETLINWYTLRNIFMNYGKRFTDRLIIQVTIFCVFVLISLIIIFFIFLGYIQQMTIMVIYIFNHKSLNSNSLNFS